ncbi:MAG: acetylglutamate kinase [Spirochaetales bacterium]|nr:acetylglutamate kinase [Spirochaetales bacterium]
MSATMAPTIVKIGGKLAANPHLMTLLAQEFSALISQGKTLLLVHGGGVAISELQHKYGLSPQFIEGRRHTPEAEMPLVDMALAGTVNKDLVRLFTAQGALSWGLSGADAQLIQAQGIGEKSNRTGFPHQVNPAPLHMLWSNGYLPIVAPPSSDQWGGGMNVNADEAALAIAKAVQASALIFLSDVPGVLVDANPIPSLNPQQAEKLISSEVISGGMIPKVRSAVAALSDVEVVHIANYQESGHLQAVLQQQRGTAIKK